MRGYRIALGILLTSSLGLRIALALGGGQQYWPDEDRYFIAKYIVAHVSRGEWHEAWVTLFQGADHMLFRIIGLPPALFEHFYGAHPAVAASYFGAFSVLCVGLLWLIARRAGADEEEAWWAAFLAAASGSLFFYARHYFPYDASLFLMLSALWLALAKRQNWWWDLMAGALVGLGFLTYNGYWGLGGAILVWSVLRDWPDFRKMTGRAFWGGFGLGLPLAGLIMAARGTGVDLVESFRNNAGTITQGDYGMGWRVVVEYFWYVESALAGLLGIGLLVAVIRVCRGQAEPRLAGWLIIGAVLLACLLLCSDVFHLFVVYGRTARALVPFACLIAAGSIAVFLRPRGMGIRFAFTGVVILCAAINFSRPLRQVFPTEFRRVARVVAGRAQEADGYGLYTLLHAEHLWGDRIVRHLPPHEVVFRRPHPLQYRPYQYEGFDLAQRRELAATDISMRVVRYRGTAGTNTVSLPRNAANLIRPGPVKMRLRFPTGRAGYTEPLIVTGRPAEGDLLFVRYEDSRTIRIGWDHWGGAGGLSEPLAIEPGREQELIVSMGSLAPDQPARTASDDILTQQLSVVFNGRLVLCRRGVFFPTEASDIFFGGNFIGGTTTGGAFTGDILGVEPATIAEIGIAVPALAAQGAWRDQRWGGSPGPVRLTVTLDSLLIGEAAPILAHGIAGRADLLLLKRVGRDAFVFQFDHWGGDMKQSPPVTMDASRPHSLRLSLGGLMPEPSAPIYREHPLLLPLRDLILVEVDERPVWVSQGEFHRGGREWAIGANLVGASSGSQYFPGGFRQVELIDPANLLRAFSRLDQRMRVASKPELLGGFPGPVKLRIKFPDAAAGTREPLLSSGVTGAGDFVTVHYQPDHQLRFGFDHWGAGGPESAPVPFEPGKEYELTLTAGFLLPQYDGQTQRVPGALQQLVLAKLDDRVVLVHQSPTHPVTLDQVYVGVNLIGGSTSGPAFSGEIAEIMPASIESILPLLDKVHP